MKKIFLFGTVIIILVIAQIFYVSYISKEMQCIKLFESRYENNIKDSDKIVYYIYNEVLHVQNMYSVTEDVQEKENINL